mmetsp:Transcript_3283/g.6802  ORF Transcript_3283/g.6802 Transcript_3283/m.6802 type:complete len:201 (-) Transcript_3283:848-1450(-)
MGIHVFVNFNALGSSLETVTENLLDGPPMEVSVNFVVGGLYRGSGRVKATRNIEHIVENGRLIDKLSSHPQESHGGTLFLQTRKFCIVMNVHVDFVLQQVAERWARYNMSRISSVAGKGIVVASKIEVIVNGAFNLGNVLNNVLLSKTNTHGVSFVAGRNLPQNTPLGKYSHRRTKVHRINVPRSSSVARDRSDNTAASC